MCHGIALSIDSFRPEQLIRLSRHQRTHERDGQREIRFLWRQRPRWLPVWFEGQLRVMRWGCQREESRRLPPTGWTWRSTVEMGGWGPFHAEPVIIPATYGLDTGVWFTIERGIEGLVVRDEQQIPCVYMICEPATWYYEILTRNTRMPVLVKQRIGGDLDDPREE